MASACRCLMRSRMLLRGWISALGPLPSLSRAAVSATSISRERAQQSCYNMSCGAHTTHRMWPGLCSKPGASQWWPARRAHHVKCVACLWPTAPWCQVSRQENRQGNRRCHLTALPRRHHPVCSCRGRYGPHLQAGCLQQQLNSKHLLRRMCDMTRQAGGLETSICLHTPPPPATFRGFSGGRCCCLRAAHILLLQLILLVIIFLLFFLLLLLVLLLLLLQ